jgi:hypothetical protein
MNFVRLNPAPPGISPGHHFVSSPGANGSYGSSSLNWDNSPWSSIYIYINTIIDYYPLIIIISITIIIHIYIYNSIYIYIYVLLCVYIYVYIICKIDSSLRLYDQQKLMNQTTTSPEFTGCHKGCHLRATVRPPWPEQEPPGVALPRSPPGLIQGLHPTGEIPSGNLT